MTLQIPRTPSTPVWSPAFDHQSFPTTTSNTTVVGRTLRGSHSLPSLPLFLEARSHALAEPLKPAIIDKTKNESFTYLELLSDVAIFKTKIQQILESYSKSKVHQRVEEPRIAFLVPAGYDYVVAQWAIWATGAICVPLCMSTFLPGI
jgi:acyl-CoA synthetase (AMP-forming)/AMP-acid ligase II